ncbi:MAG: DUF5063 domain-containing protein [Methylococcales bacterium]
MSNYITHLSHLEVAARDFCLLVEHVELYKDRQWLPDLARILPRIQSSMTHLDDLGMEYSFFLLPDLEERFELYCRLKHRLGVHDNYPMEHDSDSVPEEMTGSLAGDLADIYFELKRGLNLANNVDTCKIDLLRLWQTGYILHWGERLLYAQRHLFSLRIDHGYDLR